MMRSTAPATAAINRQQAFSGTVAADLPLAALEAYLANYIAGYAGSLAAERFKGGQSNPTYRLSTPERSYVLRRKPFGKLLISFIRHAMRHRLDGGVS